MPAWISHVLGLDNPSGAFYLWWSGIFGDVTIIGAGIAVIRKHQCHVRGCWRIGRHAAGAFSVCRRHHPRIDDAPTAADVAAHLDAEG